MSEQNLATQEELKPSGYRVENVILLESVFKREIETGNNFANIEGDLKIDTQANETTLENKFGVTLMLTYKGIHDQKDVCSVKIRMTGIFEKYGEPPLSEDKFKAVNAPAIIYPFIREHLNGLCLKAGLTNVLLPTVNFRP